MPPFLNQRPLENVATTRTHVTRNHQSAGQFEGQLKHRYSILHGYETGSSPVLSLNIKSVGDITLWCAMHLTLTGDCLSFI